MFIIIYDYTIFLYILIVHQVYRPSFLEKIYVFLCLFKYSLIYSTK